MNRWVLRLLAWVARKVDGEVYSREELERMRDAQVEYAQRTIVAERRLEERRVVVRGEERLGVKQRTAILQGTGEEFPAIQAILEEADVLWWEYCGNATQPGSGDRVIHGAHGAMDALALLKLRVKRMCEPDTTQEQKGERK